MALGILITIVTFVFLKEGTIYFGILHFLGFAWILAVLLTSILITWWALRISKGRITVRWQMLHRNFLFGIRLYPGNIAQFLNYRLDVFLVGLFLTPRDVGIYVTATMLAEKLWEIPRAISTVLLHRIASERDNEIAAATTARVSRVITVVIGGTSLLVVAASYPAIYLMYGQAYLPAASALIALVPGIWFLSVGKLLATHLSATGRPEIGTFGAIVSLVATFTLDFLLIPRIGIIGASIASSMSYMLSTTIFVIVFVRSASLSVADVILISRGDVVLLYKAFGSMWTRRWRKI
jgi:O-antigen/teichoic acid export membrane protein